MTRFDNVRGVLFDPGDTPARPIGGAWFTGHRFDDIISAHGLSGIDWRSMDSAIDVGMAYLTENHSLTTLEDSPP